MHCHCHPMRRALGRLAAFSLLGALLTLAPSAQAQSGGPLIAVLNDLFDDSGNLVANVVSGAPKTGTFRSVSAGDYRSIAIGSDGTLVSWGNPLSGMPAGIFKAVAVGDYHAVAIRSNGSLVAWGNDAFYGDEDDTIVTATIVSSTPTTGIYTAVSAGEFHSVALRADGVLVAWGLDEDGQVSGTPSGTFKAIAAGDAFNVALRSNGALVAWGSDSDGEVSDTPSGTFKAIAAGKYHGLAIRTDGSLVAWGKDDDGQVSGTPTTGTYVAVSAGEGHSVALRSDGTLVAWGRDDNGQVSGIPAGIFQAIAASGSYNVGIKGYAWSGFLQPINTDGSSVFKLGSTVPVKFRLTDLSSAINNVAARLTFVRIGDAGGTVNEAVSTSAADSGNLFRYDAGSGQYIFNWSTKGLTVGTYQLQVDLGDGVSHTVNVGLR